MQWQDAVVSTGSLVFVVALVPTVRGPDKPALSTSVVTGTVLAVFAVTYLTLSLWFSTATTALTSVVWWMLALQRFRQNGGPSRRCP